ncbi:MAG: AAA family ATPase [Planctomycetes bacterium]|nr:AAA family ATPase [Planctomycetota bacterium]
MECIAIINQKGGVGKTSTAVNLGAGLAQRGKRMLLIDLDPQGHLTTHFGLDGDAAGRGVYEVLTQNLPIEEAIHPYSPTISVIPSNVDLAAAEVELVSVVGREVILRDLLAAKNWPYDIVMLDCPPSLGILSLNALCMSTRVLIPVQPHFLALQGAGKLFETIALVNHRLNPKLSVAGMVMCLYDAGTRLSAEVVDDLAKFLDSSRGTKVPWSNARIFKNVIRRNVKLAECPSYGQSIFEYAPRSNGATDYLALADELLEVIDGRTKIPSDESLKVPPPETEATPKDRDEPVSASMPVAPPASAEKPVRAPARIPPSSAKPTKEAVTTPTKETTVVMPTTTDPTPTMTASPSL